MTYPDLTAGIAHEHERDLRAGATRARLAAIANCFRSRADRSVAIGGCR